MWKKTLRELHNIITGSAGIEPAALGVKVHVSTIRDFTFKPGTHLQPHFDIKNMCAVTVLCCCTI